MGHQEPIYFFTQEKIQEKADNKEKLKILVTSPGGYLGRGRRYNDAKKKQIEKLTSSELSFDQLLYVERRMRKFLADVIEALGEQSVQVIVKPHPNEHDDYWDSVAERFSNVSIINGPISDAVQSADVIVGANYCQTIFDARAAAKLSVSLDVEGSDQLYSREWLNSSQFSFSSVQDVLAFLETLSVNRINELVQEDLSSSAYSEYERQFFYKIDGYRAIEHARELLSLIEEGPIISSGVKKGELVKEIFLGVKSVLKSLILISLYKVKILNFRHKNSFYLSKPSLETTVKNFKGILDNQIGEKFDQLS